jgi:hypothetical protein
VAAHVRLRSGRYSIEVLDFPILLSPNDVFWFQFQAIANADGGLDRVEIISTDKKTIEYSGLNTLSAIPGAYVKYDSATGTLTMSLTNNILQGFTSIKNPDYKTLNETTQGYLEVIGLFAIEDPKSQNFYSLMGSLWNDKTGAVIGTGTIKYASSNGYPALDVGKYLAGHVFVGDFQTGLYMGYTMKAIKDFRAGIGGHRDFCIRGLYNGNNVLVNPATILYNYNNDKAYNAPDWATDFGPTANDGDSTVGVAKEDPGVCVSSTAGCFASISFSLDEFDNALYKDSIYSTFFNTGFSGQTYSLISVLAPSKFLHWFYDANSGLKDLNQINGNCWPVGSISQAYSLRAKLPVDDVLKGIGNICVETYGFWDLEEKTIRISSPGVGFRLPYELNFLPVGYESYLFLQDFCYLVPTDQTPFWFYASDAKAGRFKLDHFTYCDGNYGGDPRVTDLYYATHNCAGYKCYSFTPYLLPAGELPVLSLGMDVEGTNYPHARLFEIQWDNIAKYGTYYGYGGQ